MPFWSRKGEQKQGETQNENGVNYKARLEHKQFLAQQCPEPIYDLSECNLKCVPAGVSARCKVLLKQSLLLHDNVLTTLSPLNMADLAESLQLLDLSRNQLQSLPDQIGLLIHLRVLRVNSNRLKYLPSNISMLKNLEELELSHNSLKELPLRFYKLSNLRKLDISNQFDHRGIATLTHLDPKLAFLKNLKGLKVDAEYLVYPAPSVAKEGIQAIMKFFCRELGIEYTNYPNETISGCSTDINDNEKNGQNLAKDDMESVVQNSLRHIENQRKLKVEQLLSLEKSLQLQASQESALAAAMTSNKQKLIKELEEDEKRQQTLMQNIQLSKDQEKQRLIQSLAQVEKSSGALIAELVSINQRDPQLVLEEMERERRELLQLISIKKEEEQRLRHNEILREMEQKMEEEVRRQQQLRQQGQSSLLSSTLNDEDQRLQSILALQGERRDSLLRQLLEEERYQREAFASLYLDRDSRLREMNGQMEQVQNELANITRLELAKRDLKMDFEKELMEERRRTLAKLLLQLMEQREMRSKQLRDRLNEMEVKREKDVQDFWLIQYQRLLDSKPKILSKKESELDPIVSRVMQAAEAEQYLPIFASRGISAKQMRYFTEEDLKNMGLGDGQLRRRILQAIEEENEREMNNKESNLPSAPLESEIEEEKNEIPSAPLLNIFHSNECVICLDNKCDVIFLPCGHVCICSGCDSKLSLCPLCRTYIRQRINLG